MNEGNGIPPRALELHPARLLNMVETETLGRTVVLYDRTGSTNAVGVGAAELGLLEGTLIVADQQTEGRGRKGRSWFSAAGKSILFSLVLRPAREEEGLTSLLALSAARALDIICGKVWIKWPNDIFVEGKKVGGVLAERRGEVVIIGLGLNVNESPEDFPEELMRGAISLKIASGREHDRGEVVKSIVESFEEAYRRWEGSGLGLFTPDIMARLLYLGEDVVLASGGDVFDGRVRGITSEGYLRLVTGEEERVFSCGDITLRKD